jgi:glycosylphosphatidylinositol transamidase (GPIT) subunit GPI8
MAMGSSSLSEKSLSHGFDYELNIPKSDDFSFYFDEVLSEKAAVKGKPNLDMWTFNDLLKYMDKDKLKVNAKLIANGVSKHQKLSSFVKCKAP